MAKATLEYDLNDHDDMMAHMRAVKSLDLALVLWEITYNTKKGIQNEIEFKKIDAYEAVDMIFSKLHQELSEHGINLDELVN